MNETYWKTQTGQSEKQDFMHHASKYTQIHNIHNIALEKPFLPFIAKTQFYCRNLLQAGILGPNRLVRDQPV